MQEGREIAFLSFEDSWDGSGWRRGREREGRRAKGELDQISEMTFARSFPFHSSILLHS